MWDITTEPAVSCDTAGFFLVHEWLPSKILSLAVKNNEASFLFLARLFLIFEVNLQDTRARCEISKQAWYYFARLFLIFEVNLQDTFARCEK